MHKNFHPLSDESFLIWYIATLTNKILIDEKTYCIANESVATIITLLFVKQFNVPTFVLVRYLWIQGLFVEFRVVQ